MSARASYTLDLLVAYISRTVIYLGFLAFVATYLGGCSTWFNGLPSTIEVAALAPITGQGSASKTWNSKPLGGQNEKSNSAPCGPVE